MPDGRIVVDANVDAVRIFEMISWLQIIPTSIALVDRILEFFHLSSLDGVMLILESLSAYLLYIKILALQEKASTVNVEII
jgi:hypothetical protein